MVKLNKKLLKKLVMGVLIAGLLVLNVGCSGNGSPNNDDSTSTEDVTQKPAQEHFDVGIIQYMSHGALDAAREGFIAGLADNGYVEEKILLLIIKTPKVIK